MAGSRLIGKVLATGGAILAFIFWIGLEDLFKAISQISFCQFLVAGSATLVVSFSQTYRLHTLIPTWMNSYTRLLKIGLISQFFNNFLPGAVSGDIYKAVIFKKKSNKPYLHSASILLLDRVSGLVSTLIIFGWSALLLFDTSLDFMSLPVILGALGVSSIVLVMFLSTPLSIVDKVLQSISTVRGLKLKIVAKFALANVLVAGLRWLKFLALSLIVGMHLSIIEIAFLVLAVQLAMLIPLSIGAYGIMEGALVAALLHFGISNEEAVQLAMLNRFGAWTCSVVGIVIWLKEPDYYAK